MTSAESLSVMRLEPSRSNEVGEAALETPKEDEPSGEDADRDSDGDRQRPRLEPGAAEEGPPEARDDPLHRVEPDERSPRPVEGRGDVDARGRKQPRLR